MARRNPDLTGMKFGRLQVISKVSAKGERHTKYLCRCECGSEKTIDGGHLTYGDIKSCGCYRVEVPQIRFRKHSKKDQRLYNVWCDMKARCNNPNIKEYQFYGGRGIRVCDEWVKDFSAFASWSKKSGYKPDAPRGECTIDRIDTNGNYSPDNCRWITQQEQGRNTRACRYISYGGETLTLSEWSRRLGMRDGAVSRRLRRGWTEIDAVTIPPDYSRHKVFVLR